MELQDVRRPMASPDMAPFLQELQERLVKIEHNHVFGHAAARQRSARMLLVGAVSGLLGFAFAMIIGIMTEQTSGKVDINGRPFASGRGYFPATVSEMVHDPLKPAGKTFFAFCFVGAIFIFFSKYPSQLRNVYIGDDEQLCGVSWVAFRQFVPAPGMMLLAIVTTTPTAQAGPTDNICVALHLVGAAMLFVGYFAAEAHCVGWRLIPRRTVRLRHVVYENRLGLKQRKMCLTVIAIGYIIFLVMQVVLGVKAPFIDPENDDKWGHLPGHDGIHLVDSARWPVKILKVVSYSSEVVCGLALICSHLVIWYHCEERHYDLPEELEQLGERLNRIPNQRSKLIDVVDLPSESDESEQSSESGLCA